MTLKLSQLSDEVEISAIDTYTTYTVVELKNEILKLGESHHETGDWHTITKKRWVPSADRMVELFVDAECEEMYEDWDERAMDSFEKHSAIKKIQDVLDETFKDAYATAYWTYEEPVEIDIYPYKYLVTWNDELQGFEEIEEACKFAESKGSSEKINTYVWGIKEGIKNEEPFLSCEWGF